MYLFRHYCAIKDRQANKFSWWSTHFLIPNDKALCGGPFSQTANDVYEIRNCHGGKDVHIGLLGCSAVYTCKYIPEAGGSIFHRKTSIYQQLFVKECYNTDNQHRRTRLCS